MMPTTAPSTSAADDWIAEGWQIIVVRGVLAVIFGIVAAIWPISTAATLIMLWGVWAGVDGISSLVQALRPATPMVARVGNALMGVLGLAAAFLALVRPGLTAVALTWVLGIWLIARGLLDLVLALGRTPPAPRALLAFSGVVDLLLGVLFAANPGRAAVGGALISGLVAIVWGLVFIAVGLVARSQVRSARETLSRPLASTPGGVGGGMPPSGANPDPADDRPSATPPA